jgi:phenylacetate-CoA ligase
MFVHPKQIADIVRRHPEVAKACLIVTSSDSQDSMQLECEVEQASPDLEKGINASLKIVTNLNGKVTFVAPGNLANDGKVIDDRREQG